MAKQDPLPNYRKQGGQISSEGSSSSIPKSGGSGKIQTNWKSIEWTPKKLLIATILIGAPYLGGIIASLWGGMTLITLILVGLGILVGILYGVLRWLEQTEL
jgi:hypothetical protein